MKTSYFHSSQLIFVFLLVLSLGFTFSCSSSEESNDSAYVAPDNSTDNLSTATTDNSSVVEENSGTTTTDNSSSSDSGSATVTGSLPSRTTPILFTLGEYDLVQDITLDLSDNIYVTGSTEGPINPIDNSSVNSAFVVKYDASGGHQWSKEFGSGSDTRNEGRAIITDSMGNIYITGVTNGSFDGISTPVGFSDQFLIKYNSSWVNQWTKQLTSSAFPSEDRGTSLNIDSENNIYMVGDFSKKYDPSGNELIDFGSIFGTNFWTNSSIDSTGNIYIITGSTLFKYDASGVQQWTKTLNVATFSKGISVDSVGSIYITGSADSGIDNNTFLGGWSDIFLEKYDNSGVKQWSKQLGTASGDSGNGIIVDSNDNVYITGTTSGQLSGNSTGSTDVFLAKYNSSGVQQWIHQNNSNSSDDSTGIALDSSDNVYVTGKMGSGNLFIFKYESNGVKVW